MLLEFNFMKILFFRNYFPYKNSVTIYSIQASEKVPAMAKPFLLKWDSRPIAELNDLNILREID